MSVHYQQHQSTVDSQHGVNGRNVLNTLMIIDMNRAIKTPVYVEQDRVITQHLEMVANNAKVG